MTMQVSKKTIPFLALCLFFATLPFLARAQTCPNTGEVPITAATRDLATLAGIPINSPCWLPSDENIGLNVALAKQYLTSLPRNGTTASPAHIQKLNATFAVCAAQFFQAYTARYGSVTITSTYRDGLSGENARVGGVPGSNHTRGVAIDVHPANKNYDSMMNFARANPQLGVCFPRPTYRGRPDLPHMILAGIGGGESARCAAQGVTKQCSGTPPLNIVTPSYSGPAPSASVTNALRNLFAPPQQPAPQVQNPIQPPPQHPPQVQHLPAPLHQQHATAPPSQQTPDLTATRATTHPPTPAQGQPEKKQATSAVQILSEWILMSAEPIVVEIGTGTSLELFLSGEDIVELRDDYATDETLVRRDPTALVLPIEQTFTSPDLANLPEERRTELAGYQAFLERVKEALLTMLAYLKPFGRPQYYDDFHGE